MHCRTKVRNGVVALVTGLPTTGARAYVGRTRPLGEAHAPTLLVYARATPSQVDEQGDPPTLLHELELFVEGRVSRAAADDDDDVSRLTEEQLDQIEVEVAGALMAQGAFAGLAPPVPIHAIFLRRSTLSAQAPGSRHEGEVRIEFTIQFRTPEDDLSTFA